jgi:anti-anti-sigma factor
VLALRGELDATAVAELSSQLTAVMSGESWVIVDLAELAFMDCSALEVLADARERARRAGGDVLLADPREAVTQLSPLTGPAWVAPVFPSIGLAGFSAGLAAFTSRLAARAREAATAAGQGTAGPAGRQDYLKAF